MAPEENCAQEILAELPRIVIRIFSFLSARVREKTFARPKTFGIIERIFKKKIT